VSRRRSICCAAALACALVACSDPGPPDVLLLVVDTLRADRLSLYGSPRITSPRLDRFASESVVFDAAVAPASWTLPSVASLMTSRHPSVHGLRARNGSRHFTTMRTGLTTLSEAFLQGGYRTVALGTNPWVSASGHGLRRGFEDYRVLTDETADEVNAQAREILESNDARPLFLYVHYMDVHGPYVAGRDEPIPELGALEERYTRKLAAAERKKLPGYLVLEGADSLDTYVDAYDRGIRAWDREFGELVDWLDETGRLERTIVAVTSDHGEEFLEHGGWNHGETVYEEQIRVPWVLRAPGVPPRRISRLASLIDVGPTLLALAAIDVPETMVGVNALADGRPGQQRAVFSETHLKKTRGRRRHKPPLVAMRRGNQKWIVEGPRRRCFDLASDPLEQREVKCDPAGYAEIARWLAEVERRGKAFGEQVEFEPSEERKQHLRELGYVE
jgi:arylsulfatase A-like enzyme